MKTWWKAIIGLFVLLLIIWYALDNLKVYSVYYAKQTPHKEGVEPVLMMLMENLDSIYNPQLDGYTYDFDGSPAILKEFNSVKKHTLSKSFWSNDVVYVYRIRESGKISYIFNKQFVFVIDVVREGDVLVDENTIKNDIYSFVQPIINVQPTPIINLQWLFDWLYYDKFN